MEKQRFEKEYEFCSRPLSERDAALLCRTVEIAREAVAEGNHPFGCLLSDEAGNILLEQGNEERTQLGDCTAHAETVLMRRASRRFSRETRQKCSLFTSAEPCAMCTAAAYWAGIGRIVYLISEQELLQYTGDDPRNPTLSLPCRVVLSCGQKTIEVQGPYPELAAAYLALHAGYWHPGGQ